MIVLMAVCAAIYGVARAVLKIDFYFLTPDITEVGVANLFPMVFGLLFGPAGAWGAAFGNLIGDLFGTLTWPTASENPPSGVPWCSTFSSLSSPQPPAAW
jgi:hypothetical protein